MKKKFNFISIISLISIIISIAVFLLWPDINTAIIGYGIVIFTSLIAIICGFIARSQIKKNKEKGKGIALTSIILGFIICIWSAFIIVFIYAIKDVKFNDSIICPKVNNCIDNQDGTSTCYFQDALKIPCSTSNLTKEQFKK